MITGCNTTAFIGKTGIDKIRQAADITARGAIQGPCLITLGAAQRELTPRERELAMLIAATSCTKANSKGLTETEKQSLSEK